MGTVRSRHLSLVALFAGALLVISGLVSPAQAATTRTLSIAITPTTTYAGSVISVSGKISRSPKGTVVKVQRKVGKKWVAARNTVTTTTAGNYLAKVTLPSTAGTYSFRSVVSAKGSLRAATSKTVNVVALRRVSATIKATPTLIQLGSQVNLAGKIAPFVAGKVAFIQRFNGASWTIVTTATISKTGTYSRTFAPNATTTYRVYVPRSGYLAAATSASTKVTISNGPIPPEVTTTSLPNGRTETAYSKTLTKTGAAGTWAVTAGVLPGGLSLNTSSGAITGTPTATGDFPFTVTYSETSTALNDSQALSIHVDPIAKITTSSLTSATAYAQYSMTLTKSGLAGTWSITSGTLPSGITLDGSTGIISGKTALTGDFPLTFKFTDSTSYQVSKSLPLHVNPAPDPVISTTALTNATAYATYSFSIVKTGNAGTWMITSGTLPAGVTLDTTTGVLSGKPTVSGDFPLTFKFTETESGTNASKSLPLHVNPAPDPVITTAKDLPAATAYSTYTPLQLARNGNEGTWTVDAGSFPAGMSLSAAGVLSGKPTVAGTYTPTVRFTETESGTTTTKDFSLVVNPAPKPVITTTSLPTGIKDVAYNSQVSVSTLPAGAWSITAGALPTGVSLNPTTGAITGTPSVAGVFAVTFTFTETESSAFANKALSITIYDRPTITTTSLSDATRGSSYSKQLTKTGGSGSGAWSLSAGTLPAGLTLSAAGVISGTPTTLTDAANENFTVRFTDSVTGLSTTKVLAIHVAMAGAPTFNTAPTLPAGQVATAYSTTLSGNGGLAARWSIDAGSLPPGLSINAITGTIAGTPTTPGDYAFVVRFGTLIPLTYNTRQYFIHVAP